ncbi:rCG35100, partial [Rattus norvegicus]
MQPPASYPSEQEGKAVRTNGEEVAEGSPRITVDLVTLLLQNHTTVCPLP